MSWFLKKKYRDAEKKNPHAAIQDKEIEHMKKQKEQIFKQAHESSKQLNCLLEANGFTIKIARVTGGYHNAAGDK